MKMQFPMLHLRKYISVSESESQKSTCGTRYTGHYYAYQLESTVW